MALKIQKETSNEQLLAKLTGSFDALSAKEFDIEFETLPKSVKTIELDFSAVDYISSSGLRSLIMLKKLAVKQNGNLCVKYPQPLVKEVFDTTNFDALVEIAYGESSEDTPAGGYYPLRPVQAWLVDTHFYKADSTMMNNGALLKLNDAIDMERLAGALNSLLADYDIFRCRLMFHPDTGEICQRFDGAVSEIVVESLSEERFNQRKQDLKKPYQIINSPLYRIYLMTTPNGKYIYADFYHAIMDGTAIVILFWREVNKRYQGKKINRQRTSYAEYVMEEAKELAKGQKEGHLYWQKILAGFDPKKHLPPAKENSYDEWELMRVERDIKNIRQDFFKTKKNYSENTFMLAGTMLGMAKITGEKDVIMSWVHNARPTMKEMRLMGLMLDQYPIRWDFNEDMKAGEFLSRLEASVNKGMSYAKGLDEVYKNDLEGECATFILQKDTDANATYTLDGMPCQVVEVPANQWSATENVLDIVVSALDDGNYYLTLNFDGDRFSRDTMERYASLVDEILLALKNDEQDVSEILSR